MLSVSLSSSPSPTRHTYFSRTATDATTVGGIITSRVWSPCLWTGGVRRRENFDGAVAAALDFDDGALPLEAAIAELDALGVAYVAGTTKSHRIPKGALPAVDRFRILLPAASAVATRGDFEGNMKRLVATWGADVSCVDAGRFFFPCREVVAVRLEPERARLHWLPGLDRDTEVAHYREMTLERMAECRRSGVIPHEVGRQLAPDFPHKVGERHVTVYKLAVKLTLLGFTPEKIFRTLMSTTLSSIGEHDVKRAARNGVDAAYRDYGPRLATLRTGSERA